MGEQKDCWEPGMDGCGSVGAGDGGNGCGDLVQLDGGAGGGAPNWPVTP